MARTQILILCHYFIRRLHVFLRQNFRHLHIDGDRSIKWRGIGEIEITSWKARAYGIFARVGKVSEIERVSAANE